MKISKLFHWLYAFLMFLPVTFLLPSLLYFGFNDNATAQEYTKEEPYYYQSNDVNSFSDILVDNIYVWNDNFEISPQSDNRFVFKLDTDFAKQTFTEYNNFDEFIFGIGQSGNAVIFLNWGTSTSTAFQVNTLTFKFIPTSIYSVSTVLQDLIYPHVVSSDFLYVKGYQEVTYTMGITESINQSILDTFDLPMFSWTSDNFIIAPFNYITDLFGLPNGNVVNKYLDYWLSISIIYLCFDVIMYVPLLVHRWLDKGIVE